MTVTSHGGHEAREVAKIDGIDMELSNSRRNALAGNASGETDGRMIPVSEALIVGLVRGWASDSRRTADDAQRLLQAILGAILSPRERAERVDAEIVRRAG